MKAVIKRVLLFLLLVVMAYLITTLLMGGFGSNPVSVRFANGNDSLFLFAHRGVVTQFPENSRESIEAAKQRKFKGLEVDIRKTADNHFVLFHDEDGRRLLGVNKKISAMTLSEILRYRLLKDGVPTQSSVLTLHELFTMYHDDFTIYLDMKLGDFREIDELVRITQTHRVTKSVIVASVSIAAILYIRYKYPAIRTSMEGFNSGNEWAWYLIPRDLKPELLSGFASKVDKRHVDWMKKNDLLNRRIVYGADSTNFQTMIDLGIKNIIIDSFDSLNSN